MDRGRILWKWVRTALTFGFLLWLAHAFGVLVHEYAHSFVAWSLGYKANPLALDYGHLNLTNVLILSDIDENVDYAPIFAAGRGPLASLIAVAGVLFGNGVSYLVSRHFYTTAKEHGSRVLALFMFLFCIMNTGNFISYVPARTFTTHADMFTVELGLNISPWWVVIVLGVPFCIAVWHFFARILPGAMQFFFPHTLPGKLFLLSLTSFMVFTFFGSAGLHRYGEVSHWISTISVYILFPMSVLIYWPRRDFSSRSQQALA